MADAISSTGYTELIRTNRNFRQLWKGQIVSLFGDWFNLIASASLIGQLTGSGMAVGGLFVVRMLAPFLVSPIAGVAADRYDRRKLLIATDFVRSVVVLGFLFVRSAEMVWLIYVLTFTQLAMHGFFFPTRNAILPDIVSHRELGAANAIMGATWSVMLALGAAAGGLVAGGFGIYPAFIIDSATFLLSAYFIAGVDYRPPKREAHDKSLRSALGEYADGIRYLLREQDVLLVAVQKAGLTLFVVGAFEVLQVALAKDVFVIGEGGGIGLGLMYAVIGVGSGIGPILARAVTGDKEPRLRIAILTAYGAIAIGLFVVSTLSSFAAVLLGSLIRAIGGGTLWVFTTQLLLQRVPEAIRGRIFATEYAFLTLAMAASAGLTGVVLDASSLAIGDIVTWMSRLVLLPGVLWALYGLRTRRRSSSSSKPSSDSPQT